MKTIRVLNGTADVAGMRTAEFEGKSHLVVPVIAIMEGVIHAVNAETPELVLVEELLKSYAGFNGRPVVAGHPTIGAEQVSANDPKVLEREAFGQTFNTKIENNQLKTEAWIDPVAAEKNDRAKDVVRRIRAGEMVEVSVGVFVATEPTAGEKDGKEFQGIWRGIVPDHLAFLAEGIEGACSIEMGCGAPRAAQKGADGMDAKEMARLRELSSEERVRVMAVIRASQDDAQSDTDLRDALNRALQEIEPGFVGVEAVFLSENFVVYSTWVNDNWRFMKRSFTLNDKGAVKLKVDQVEVRPVTRFETLEEKKPMDEKLKARLEALIANERSPWTPCDLERLAAFPIERIEALEAAVAEPTAPKPVEKPVEKAVDKPKPEGPTDLENFTKEIGMSADEIKGTVKAAQDAEIAKKTALVTSLKAAQTVYSEDDLNKMAVCELEKLAKVVPQKNTDGVPPAPAMDFSLKGGSGHRDAQSEEGVPPPKNIFEAFSAPAK